MAKCVHCSAPLQANTNRCGYCGTYNDVDLSGKHDFSVLDTDDQHACPNCQAAMETIDLQIKGTFLLERCSDCFGLFFDPGQVEALLENSVADVFQVNLEQIDTINHERYLSKPAVKYVKCPVCQNFMNRKAYGYRSGVVVDICNSHGVWLDSGEITHLLEWRKAGGQLLQAQRGQATASPSTREPVKPRYSSTWAEGANAEVLADDVVDVLATVINTLF
ncbi:hypothetical protein JCM14076_09010 [Methylosoma difficile]